MSAFRRGVSVCATACLALMLACGGSSTDGGEEVALDPVCPEPETGVEVGGVAPDSAVTTVPDRVVVIMGGGGEDDTAARRFVEAANGGDVLILRASGSTTSYPDYFVGSLAPDPAPNSAETTKTTDPAEGGQEAVLCRLSNAEAIWLAGGNQSDYLNGWPATLHQALVAATERGVALGGTSAGAVSLGEAAFDALEGSVTSEEALEDPTRSDVSLSYPSWFQPELAGIYVDSHFMDRDREGRLLVFLARFMVERSRERVVGIGLDEGVAVVIENGTWTIHAPEGQSAWFYEVTGPASIQSGVPLELAGIRRTALADGATGAWPFDFDAAETVPMRVETGQVIVE